MKWNLLFCCKNFFLHLTGSPCIYTKKERHSQYRYTNWLRYLNRLMQAWSGSGKRYVVDNNCTITIKTFVSTIHPPVHLLWILNALLRRTSTIRRNLNAYMSPLFWLRFRDTFSGMNTAWDLKLWRQENLHLEKCATKNVRFLLIQLTADGNWRLN